MLKDSSQAKVVDDLYRSANRTDRVLQRAV